MKSSKRMPRKYRVPTEMGYLSLFTLAIYVSLSLLFCGWSYFMDAEMSLFERLLYFSNYCLGYDCYVGSKSMEFAMRVCEVFFFAAIVSLFYELYKYLVECRRLKKVERAIYNSFLWTSSRASGIDAKYVPSYKSFATLQARFGYSEKEILRACSISQRIRSINLATTRSFEDNPHDRLAVECYMKNRAYGCFINRNSPVTIVVPSATCGLGRFGFYLAVCGGFNFISKEIPDHDSTERYFNISKDYEKKNPILREYLSDARTLVTQKENSWTIVLATITLRDGNRIALYRNEKNNQRFKGLLKSLPDAICEVPIDKTVEDFHVGSNNILNKLLAFNNVQDGFVMRISNETLFWNKQEMRIILDLAHHLCTALNLPFNENVLKDLSKGRKDLVGFPEDIF